MLTTLLLSFRESLEAALVVGIILAQLSKTQQIKQFHYVIYGTILGVFVSLAGGIASFAWAKHLNEATTEVFAAAVKFLAAGLIAYFIIWIGSQNKNFSAGIKEEITLNSSIIGLFILSFLSVFREGLELTVFILTKINEKATNVAWGSGFGIILAVLITFVIFKTAVNLNLRLIFKILGLVLIYFGAEMFAEGLADLLSIHSNSLEVILKFVYGLPALVFFLKDSLPRKKLR
jgi:high-affinity iron transporter